MAIVVLKLSDIKRKIEEMPILFRNDLSVLGESEQTGQRCASTECESVSVSVLSLQADLSTLSAREREGRSDREITRV
jgi:hypothetical protein